MCNESEYCTSGKKRSHEMDWGTSYDGTYGVPAAEKNPRLHFGTEMKQQHQHER